MFGLSEYTLFFVLYENWPLNRSQSRQFAIFAYFDETQLYLWIFISKNIYHIVIIIPSF